MSRTNHTRGWGRAIKATREIGPWLPKTTENKRVLRRRARRAARREIDGGT